MAILSSATNVLAAGAWRGCALFLAAGAPLFASACFPDYVFPKASVGEATDAADAGDVADVSDAGGKIVSDAQPDGTGIPDAGSSDAGSDAQVEAGSEQTTNGSFEDGCNFWDTYHTTATPDSTFHSGSGSCRICTVAEPNGSNATFQNIAPAPSIGDSYALSAWVRTAPGAPLSWPITLEVLTETDTTASGAQTVTATASWTQLSVIWNVSAVAGTNSARVDIAIHDPAGVVAAGECFLVDDVHLVRLN